MPKVLVFSTDGDLLMSWNTTTLEMPHGIFLAGAASSDPTVWITDVGNGPYGHCIKQYSPSGKLLQVGARGVMSRVIAAVGERFLCVAGSGDSWETGLRAEPAAVRPAG